MPGRAPRLTARVGGRFAVGGGNATLPEPF
jgi:hypothetical protein